MTGALKEGLHIAGCSVALIVRLFNACVFYSCFDAQPSQDLATLTKKQKAATDKALAESSRKEEEIRMRQLSEEEEAARKRIAHVKQSLSFTLEWAQAGHAAVKVFRTMEEFQTMVGANLDKGKGCPLDAPFIVKDVGNKLATFGTATMKPFGASAAEHCVAKRKDHTSSPLTATRDGILDLHGIFDALLPAELMAPGLLPSTRAHTLKTTAFARMSSFTSCEWEPHFLGSVRWHFEGHCAYLLFSAPDLEKGLKQLHKTEKTPSHESMRTWADNLDRESLTVEQLKAFLDAGVNVHHAKVEPGEILVVPPGWLTACTVLKQSACTGVSKVFLSLGRSTLNAFSSLHRASPDDSAVKLTLDVLTISTHSGESASLGVGS